MSELFFLFLTAINHFWLLFLDYIVSEVEIWPTFCLQSSESSLFPCLACIPHIASRISVRFIDSECHTYVDLRGTLMLRNKAGNSAYLAENSGRCHEHCVKLFFKDLEHKLSLVLDLQPSLIGRNYAWEKIGPSGTLSENLFNTFWRSVN